MPSPCRIRGMLLPGVVPCKTTDVADPTWYEVTAGELAGVSAVGAGSYYHTGHNAGFTHRPVTAWQYAAWSEFSMQLVVSWDSWLASGTFTQAYSFLEQLSPSSIYFPGNFVVPCSNWAAIQSHSTVDPGYVYHAVPPGLLSAPSQIPGLHPYGNVPTKGSLSFPTTRQLKTPLPESLDWGFGLVNRYDSVFVPTPPIFTALNYGPPGTSAPPVAIDVIPQSFAVASINLCTPIKSGGQMCAFVYFGLVLGLFARSGGPTDRWGRAGGILLDSPGSALPVAPNGMLCLSLSVLSTAGIAGNPAVWTAQSGRVTFTGGLQSAAGPLLGSGDDVPFASAGDGVVTSWSVGACGFGGHALYAPGVNLA